MKSFVAVALFMLLACSTFLSAPFASIRERRERDMLARNLENVLKNGRWVRCGRDFLTDNSLGIVRAFEQLFRQSRPDLRGMCASAPYTLGLATGLRPVFGAGNPYDDLNMAIDLYGALIYVQPVCLSRPYLYVAGYLDGIVCRIRLEQGYGIMKSFMEKGWMSRAQAIQESFLSRKTHRSKMSPWIIRDGTREALIRPDVLACCGCAVNRQAGVFPDLSNLGFYQYAVAPGVSVVLPIHSAETERFEMIIPESALLARRAAGCPEEGVEAAAAASCGLGVATVASRRENAFAFRKYVTAPGGSLTARRK